MRNRLFIPDFLFDLYTNRGSIGTPSALSNVSRALNRQSAVFAFVFIFGHPSQKKWRTQGNNCRQFGSRLRCVLIFVETSTLLDVYRLQVALQVCHFDVGEETRTSGQV